MTAIWQSAIGLVLGGVFGLGFFAGLWYTVRRLPRAHHPAALALISLAVRLVLAMAGLYLVLRVAAIAGAAAAVLGFLIVRIALIRKLSSAREGR
jgi:F1F0 ATPase subunit 2